MPVYWSVRPTAWQRSFPSLDWLGDPSPVCRTPISGGARRLRRGKAARALATSAIHRAGHCAALGSSGPTGTRCRATTHRCGAGTIDLSDSRTVLHAAARAIAELGCGHALALFLPSDADGQFHYFAAQLARLADRTGFTLACVAPEKVRMTNQALQKYAVGVDHTEAPHRFVCLPVSMRRASRL